MTTATWAVIAQDPGNAKEKCATTHQNFGNARNLRDHGGPGRRRPVPLSSALTGLEARRRAADEVRPAAAPHDLRSALSLERLKRVPNLHVCSSRGVSGARCRRVAHPGPARAARHHRVTGAFARHDPHHWPYQPRFSGAHSLSAEGGPVRVDHDRIRGEGMKKGQPSYSKTGR